MIWRSLRCLTPTLLMTWAAAARSLRRSSSTCTSDVIFLIWKDLTPQICSDLVIDVATSMPFLRRFAGQRLLRERNGCHSRKRLCTLRLSGGGRQLWPSCVDC